MALILRALATYDSSQAHHFYYSPTNDRPPLYLESSRFLFPPKLQATVRHHPKLHLIQVRELPELVRDLEGLVGRRESLA
jgi:hypothetical protein